MSKRHADGMGAMPLVWQKAMPVGVWTWAGMEGVQEHVEKLYLMAHNSVCTARCAASCSKKDYDARQGHWLNDHRGKLHRAVGMARRGDEVGAMPRPGIGPRWTHRRGRKRPPGIRPTNIHPVRTRRKNTDGDWRQRYEHRTTPAWLLPPAPSDQAEVEQASHPSV